MYTVYGLECLRRDEGQMHKGSGCKKSRMALSKLKLGNYGIILH